MTELDPTDHIFLIQISDNKTYASCSWTKPHTDRLEKLGYVKSVNGRQATFQITAAGKQVAKAIVGERQPTDSDTRRNEG